MLVLSRKPGERILIGDEIRITTIRIGPNSVRYGIEAPPGVGIVREELLGRQPLPAQAPDVMRPMPAEAAGDVEIGPLLDLERH